MAIKFDENEGPGRFCLFLLDASTGAPITYVPVFATAVIGFSQSPAPNQGQPPSADIALGVLATDHTGYASWDLEPLRRQIEVLAVNSVGAASVGELQSLWLHLAGPLQSVLDALTDALVGPDAIALRLAVDRTAVYEADAGTYPSMQSPTLVDLNLSPGSFATVPAAMVGQDGCESLLPSNVATQRYQVHQIVQLPSQFNVMLKSPPTQTQTATLSTTHIPAGVSFASPMARPIEFQPLQFTGNTPLALVITYDVTWTPVGHGLGQIAYSLPLAPGEQVNVAVVDWARQSTDSRAEETTLTDTLEHSQVRDRSIDEVVSASVHEFQAGGSILGGIAAAVSSAYGSAVGSIGGGYATTTGDRDVSGQTVQSLQDSFAQHSTSVRDLRSTVVVQSNQSEQSTAQTRTVRNHNHAHSLTILYYEVLRHYRVVVERGAVTPAILVPGDMPDFDELSIYTYRRFLEPALIDGSLQPGFDAVEKFFAWSQLPMVAPYDPGAAVFDTFTITMQVGGISSPGGGSIGGKLGLADSTEVDLIRQDDAAGTDTSLQAAGDMTQPNQPIILTAKLVQGRAWRDMRYFQINFKLGDYGDSTKIEVIFDSVLIVGQDQTGQTRVLVQAGSSGLRAPQNSTWIEHWLLFVPPAPPPPAVPTPASKLSDDENLLRVRLKWHLDHNKAYYYRLVWLGEDPNSRYQRLKASTVEFHGQTRPIFEAVMNRSLDVLGDSTAFALDPTLISLAIQGNGQVAMPPLPIVAPARDERVVSLPTRGVFAEAKLGHCNAAELIDNTRFWDWQTSPDPDAATAISDVSLASRNAQPNLTPTTLPASAVNIVNPSPAPDPIAMAGALALLGKSDIFRDMSTQSEVAGIVTSLAGDATTLAGKQIDKSGGSAAGSSGTPAVGSGKTGASTTSGGTTAGGTVSGDPTATPSSATTSATPSASSNTPSGSSSPAAVASPLPSTPAVPPAAPAPPRAITSKTRSLAFDFFKILDRELSTIPGASSVTGTFTIDISQNGVPVGKGVAILGQTVIIQANLDVTMDVAISINGTVTFLGTPSGLLAAGITMSAGVLDTFSYSNEANPAAKILKLKGESPQYEFTVSRNSTTATATLSRSELQGTTTTVDQTIGGKLGGTVEVVALEFSGSMSEAKQLTTQDTTSTSFAIPYVVYDGTLTVAQV